ncbi:pro-opiomelanocortin-like [Archocentrus centrarchus]|uniref:pro-opiomelanocortin-like n=1 Tax=Archocentrus centrarchus TaxID=63155 RepID=UPI0011E9E4AB|nr:pro-opiomelanocortin-like [Archocentrus centrarchus]
MCPVLLLVAVVVVGVVRGAGQCWDHPVCQQVNSERSMTECIQLCHFENNDKPIIPGDAHLQPPPSSFFSSPQAKRSYSMEHFRWGKPVGRKRRPIKIYTTNGMEDESADLFPSEMRKRELAREMMMEENEERVEEVGQEALPGDSHEKNDEMYKMKHFRWGSLPASKRYGGFMKSWDERSQRPLITLFKNVINKDAQEEKREQ